MSIDLQTLKSSYLDSIFEWSIRVSLLKAHANGLLMKFIEQVTPNLVPSRFFLRNIAVEIIKTHLQSSWIVFWITSGRIAILIQWAIRSINIVQNWMVYGIFSTVFPEYSNLLKNIRFISGLVEKLINSNVINYLKERIWDIFKYERFILNETFRKVFWRISPKLVINLSLHQYAHEQRYNQSLCDEDLIIFWLILMSQLSLVLCTY